MPDVRTDAENQEILRRVRPEYDRLKTERIRSQSELDRTEKDLEDAYAEAEKKFGTRDIDALQRMVDEARSRNTAAVDEFTRSITSVKDQLSALSTPR